MNSEDRFFELRPKYYLGDQAPAVGDEEDRCDENSYCPPPSLIQQRKEWLVLMQCIDLHPTLIQNSMYKNTPPPEEIAMLIHRGKTATQIEKWFMT